MKKASLFILLFISFGLARAGNNEFTVKFDDQIIANGSILPLNRESLTFSWVLTGNNAYDSLHIITYDDLGEKLVPGNNQGRFTIDPSAGRQKSLIVKFEFLKNGQVLNNMSFTVKWNNPGGGTEDNLQNNSKATLSLSEKLSAYFTARYKANIIETDLGYILKNEDKYTIHLFFDQFGNSLFSSVPTGVAKNIITWSTFCMRINFRVQTILFFQSTKQREV